MTRSRLRTVLLHATLLFSLFGTGCPDSSTSQQQPQAPATTTQTQTPPAETPKAPLVPQRQVADWCREHGVPESICTRCNTALVAEFKAKNDWCNEHNLPESQCVTCHPELEAKFKAMAPGQ